MVPSPQTNCHHVIPRTAIDTRLRPPLLCCARRHKLCRKIAEFHYEIFQIPSARAALVERGAFAQGMQRTNGQPTPLRCLDTSNSMTCSSVQSNKSPYIRFDRIILQSGLATLSIPPENIIIDPSTPWLVIPRSLAMPFYVQTLGAAPQPATPSPRGATTPYLLPCSTPLILHLQLDGVNLTISTHDLVASAHAGTCISNLRTWVDPTEDSLVLGSIFMRSLHVAHPCYAVSEFYKRRMSMSRRGAVIGGTIGGVAGAALLAVGAYLLFRLARRGRGRNVQERGGIEFAEPRPRQPQPRSAKPSIASPPPPLPSVPYSPDTSIPLQPSTKTTEDEPPIAGPSSQPQLPSQRHLQRVEREVRTSSGSQFTEHFGDVAPEYVRTSRPRSPLGDKPLPHIPFHPPPPSAASGSSQVEQPAELSFVPFDTHAQQRKGTGSTSSSKRKDSTSPKNSLPPGAASPVESVGSYKPAEQSHSRGVSI